MSLEAQIGQRRQGMRVRTDAERASAFVHAERHSKFVRILRLALPILGVTVIAGYFISSGMSLSIGDVTASISGIQVSNGSLRMTNPKLKGIDKKNGAYVISADYADQNPKTPKIIQLHAIKAEVDGDGGGWSRMTAVRGTFDSDKQQLVMRDDIRVATSSGMTGQLTYATVDMKDQLLQSPVPVAFQMVNGTVHANQLTLHSSTHIIIFHGKVRVHLKRDKPNAQAGALTQKGSGLSPQATAGAPQAEAALLRQSATGEAAASASGAPPAAETSTAPERLMVPSKVNRSSGAEQ